MIPYCKAHGIGLIPWGPLQAGNLAHPLSTSTARKESWKGTPRDRKPSASDELIVNRVQELAEKRGWSMSEVALAWVASKVSSPIVGCISVSVHRLRMTATLLTLVTARETPVCHHSR